MGAMARFHERSAVRRGRERGRDSARLMDAFAHSSSYRTLDKKKCRFLLHMHQYRASKDNPHTRRLLLSHRQRKIGKAPCIHLPPTRRGSISKIK